ncbi:DUF6126 family protein [Streptomyces sp. KLOTTS4A1]|uniref:DUF6126 family protein n=1 Tax=Streptomyces sp. KLOTTS4A1 TaxID=3390996 RepID=UPI0039F4EC49
MSSGPQDGAKGRRSMEDRFPRGLAIRLFVYLVVGHFFAFFLYLLFEVGARGQ